MHRHDACWGAHLRLRLLAGLEAGAAQVLQAEVVWHIYQDLQLLRRPVLGYVVPVMPSCTSLLGMINATSETKSNLTMRSAFRKLQPPSLAVSPVAGFRACCYFWCPDSVMCNTLLCHTVSVLTSSVGP